MATKTKKTEAVIDDQSVSAQDHIFIKGARVHNLKNVSVAIPRSKLVVVTGVSGSGKSSLTMDTLYAEGQRRYAESLSAYARQFLMRMNKPDVDYIKGICPAIAIEQKVITRTPRSTVGSMTEVYDYLRLLFARIGKTYSPISGQLVKKHEVSDVVDFISRLPVGAKVQILVPFRRHAKRDIKEELNILMQKGFSRLYFTSAAGNQLQRIEELLEQKKPAMPGDAYVLIDRVVVKAFEEDDKHRIADSVQTAFYESEGDCLVEVDGNRQQHFSSRFELDGLQFEEPVPNLFSFNNPYGACPVCEGFGQVLGIDPDLVIPDKRLSVYENAIAPWRGEKMGEYKEQLIKASRRINFPVHKPIADLTDEQYKLLWTGNDQFYGIDEFFKIGRTEPVQGAVPRIAGPLSRSYRSARNVSGGRLRKEALYIKIGGKSIADLVDMPVTDLKQWFDDLQLSEFDQQVARRILIEVHHRIKTLLDVGLGYLTMNRVANTLSGGESQRIQLTRSLGSNLTNSLYILDEPSIGLHARDTHRLIGVLKELRNLGNTVVIVEHDEQVMQEADYIIDMGPLASHLGGEVIFAGNYQQILKDGKSLTGKYLSGQMTIEPPTHVRKWKKAITVEGARQHNLKNIDVDFPLQVLTVVSGVSGSGKTTLVKQILYPALMKLKGEFAERVGQHRALKGALDDITQVEMVDQNPIGKSSRSNPVTYIKAYDEIRDLFAKQPLSKMRGFLPKHFSFNVDGGRCDACKGEGEVIVEMQFLADVHLTCESCGGKRFNGRSDWK